MFSLTMPPAMQVFIATVTFVQPKGNYWTADIVTQAESMEGALRTIRAFTKGFEPFNIACRVTKITSDRGVTNATVLNICTSNLELHTADPEMRLKFLDFLHNVREKKDEDNTGGCETDSAVPPSAEDSIQVPEERPVASDGHADTCGFGGGSRPVLPEAET